jgi:hypothetical protein
MDEILTGLDRSMTFQIVESFRQYLHILEGTATDQLKFNKLNNPKRTIVTMKE